MRAYMLLAAGIGLAAPQALGAANAAQAQPGTSPAGQVASGQVPSGEMSAGGIHIAPPGSRPYGKSYGQWAAAWWVWALEIPAGRNPLLDKTGEDCAVHQRGPVWFLAGVSPSGEAERRCSVPGGKALLFPIINVVWHTGPGEEGYGTAPGDPGWPALRAKLRAILKCVKSPTRLALEIDGRAVPDPRRYYEQSVFFEAVLPAHPLPSPGYPGGTRLIPQLDAGFFVLIEPLPPGRHTIKWAATSTGCGFTFGENITYHLTVAPGRSGTAGQSAAD
jgi:hypothetical protein